MTRLDEPRSRILLGRVEIDDVLVESVVRRSRGEGVGVESVERDHS